MAVKKGTTIVSMKIKVVTGTDEKGSTTFSTRNFSNINPDASLDDVYSVAEAMAGLMKYEFDEVKRVESSVLTDVEA